MIRGKKGAEVGVETVIFIVLNLLFFTLLLVFAYRNVSGASVYEQAYAKQIALIIDEAKPEMTIFVSMEDGINLAKDNGVNADSIVKINKDTNEIIVGLYKTGGYSMKYFSDYDVYAKIDGIYLVLNIREKGAVE